MELRPATRRSQPCKEQAECRAGAKPGVGARPQSLTSGLQPDSAVSPESWPAGPAGLLLWRVGCSGELGHSAGPAGPAQARDTKALGRAPSDAFRPSLA